MTLRTTHLLALLLLLAVFSGCERKKAPQPWIVTEETGEADTPDREDADAAPLPEEAQAALAESATGEPAEGALSKELTDKEKKTIHAAAARHRVKDFDRIFADCYRSYRRQLKAGKRNRQPVDVRRLPEYSQLCAMGEAVLPQVVEQMLDGRNLFALKLYDDIQADPALKVAEKKCPDEAARMVQTVRLWLAQAETTEKAAD